MTDIPVSGLFTGGATTNGDAKLAQDAMLAVMRESIGGASEAALSIVTDAIVWPLEKAVAAIDTELAAAVDDLGTIGVANMRAGQIILIHSTDPARVITVKHALGGSGQILLKSGTDFALLGPSVWLMLRRKGTDLEEIARFGPLPALTPAQITAIQHNYAPAGGSGTGTYRLSSDAARSITGLAGGYDGRELTLSNVGAFPITLVSESVSSTAANRLALSGDHVIQPGQCVFLRYDGTAQRYRLISTPLEGVITPAAIAADQNDYNPASLAAAKILRISSDAARNITGLAGGAVGRVLILANVGAFDIVLKTQAAASAAANRFALVADLTIQSGAVAMLEYDDTDQRWRALASGIGSAANVGTGAGLVFRDRTGNTLNFKSIKAGTGVSVTNGADDITVALSGSANYQAFTASGTWTKPAGVTFVLVEGWGGGGAGGNGTPGDHGCGGGGGGYARKLFNASDLPASVAVAVGAGGSPNSGAGGTTTFGSYLSAYGGGGGQASPSPSNGGNGGSGLATARGGGTGGDSTGPDGLGSQGGAGGGNNSDGGWAEFGGGGGAGGGKAAGTGGGVSQFGGNGANSTGSTGGTGAAPGGGGSGGAPSTNGGAGGRGECRVFSW